MNELVKSIEKSKVLLILEWYKKRFKRSKYCKEYPTIYLYKSGGTSIEKTGARGAYENGIISIYLGSIISMKELCETIGHEYKHYLLNEKEYEKIYIKLSKSASYKNDDEVYDNHPHEIKCSRFELKWGSICFKELKNKLYKKNKG